MPPKTTAISTTTDPQDEDWIVPFPAQPLRILSAAVGVVGVVAILWLHAQGAHANVAWYFSAIVGGVVLLFVFEYPWQFRAALFLAGLLAWLILDFDTASTATLIFLLSRAWLALERRFEGAKRLRSGVQEVAEVAEKEDQRFQWFSLTLIAAAVPTAAWFSSSWTGAANQVPASVVVDSVRVTQTSLWFALVGSVLVGPLVLFLHLRVPHLPKRRVLLGCAGVLFVTAVAWSLPVWVAGNIASELLIQHALLVSLPLLGMVSLVCIVPDAYERGRGAFFWIWMLCWLFGPAFPNWAALS